MMRAVHGLRLIYQFVERQIKQSSDFCAGPVSADFSQLNTPIHIRHAELVSASIVQPKLSVCEAEWTLERKSPQVNQVQGDGGV